MRIFQIILRVFRPRSNQGVSPNSKKYCINKLSCPKNLKDIKCSLGMTGFYTKFTNQHSTISKPLTSLLIKDTPFIWTSNQETALQTVQEKFTIHPVLHNPDFSKPFQLTYDTSNIGMFYVSMTANQTYDTIRLHVEEVVQKRDLNIYSRRVE